MLFAIIGNTMLFILNLLLYYQNFIQIHLKRILYEGIQPYDLFLREFLLWLSRWFLVHPAQKNSSH